MIKLNNGGAIHPISIQRILNQFDEGYFALPEFQRGYVWDAPKVKDLFVSLFKKLPCGSFLMWYTKKRLAGTRGMSSLREGRDVEYILDGQQRITSIYGVLRGTPTDEFFDGDAKAFTGLWFNYQTCAFEFFNPKKMEHSNSKWISVTDIMNFSASDLDDIKECCTKEERENINRLLEIKFYEFPCYEIAGDFELSEIISIFNKVNTSGQKLRDTDIAIATLCGKWDDARRELLKMSKSFGAYYLEGMDISLMLRCLTGYLTGSPRYKELDNIAIEDFAAAIPVCQNLISSIIDNLRTRLGLDNGKIIASKYSFVTLVYLIKTKGEKNISRQDWGKMLYWYVHSMLWGRYSASLISNLAQDLNTISSGEGIDGLIATIKRDRGGNLAISPEDFINRGTTQSTFYPLLYMLARVYKAKDFAKGLEVDNNLLAKNSALEVHHLFPQSRLRKPKDTDTHKPYKEELINNIANYALITAQTNQHISDRDPKDYFAEYEDMLPTQWIPDDKSLWEYDRYEDFLTARRELLSDAANKLLLSLNPEHPYTPKQ